MERRADGRRLGVESLERRELLAAAVLQLRTLADSGDGPGEPIDQTPAGSTFYVEVLAEETHPLFDGLGAVAVDLAWNPGRLQVREFDPQTAVNERLPFRGGTADNEQGSIEDLRGSMFFDRGAMIGGSGPERFALLKFQAAESPGEARLSVSEGASGVVLFPMASPDIQWDDALITIVAESQVGKPASDQISPPLDNFEASPALLTDQAPLEASHEHACFAAEGEAASALASIPDQAETRRLPGPTAPAWFLAQFEADRSEPAPIADSPSPEAAADQTPSPLRRRVLATAPQQLSVVSQIQTSDWIDSIARDRLTRAR